MIYIECCDNKEIDTSDNELRNKIADAVKNYVMDNFDDVVSLKTEYRDDYEYNEYPYELHVSIQL